MLAGTRSIAQSRGRWWLIGLCAATLIAAGAPLSGSAPLLDRAFAAAIEALRHANAPAGPSAMPAYRVTREAVPVANVADNLSGLAFDPARGHLWAVVNEPPELLALATDGRVLDRHALDGFADVEGVAMLDADWLVLVEERRQALVLVPVPAPGARVGREDMQALRIVLSAQDNAGFEGVAYDRAGDRLFVVKEHSPRKLYEVRGLRAALEGRFDIEIIDREHWIGPHFLARDFSSIEFDPHSGHLLLLSDVSRLIVELDSDGRFVGYQPLGAGFAGLSATVPQAEGLTIAPDGALYLVSEPNLFYAFRAE